jgi:hypothetical protein
MPGQQRFPTELEAAEAALAVRRDIQALSMAGDPPALGPAIMAAHRALHTMRVSQLGDDVGELYRRLLEVAAAAESVAVRTRIAYPELEAIAA